MLERLGGVSSLARAVRERQRRHAGCAAMNPFGHVLEHGFSEIERHHRRGWMPLLHDAREASFAASDVGDALASQVSQMFEHQLDVQDARVYRGRVMLLVSGRLV